jgi:hypothetical protein
MAGIRERAFCDRGTQKGRTALSTGGLFRTVEMYRLGTEKSVPFGSEVRDAHGWD